MLAPRRNQNGPAPDSRIKHMVTTLENTIYEGSRGHETKVIVVEVEEDLPEFVSDILLRQIAAEVTATFRGCFNLIPFIVSYDYRTRRFIATNREHVLKLKVTF